MTVSLCCSPVTPVLGKSRMYLSRAWAEGDRNPLQEQTPLISVLAFLAISAKKQWQLNPNISKSNYYAKCCFKKKTYNLSPIRYLLSEIHCNFQTAELSKKSQVILAEFLTDRHMLPLKINQTNQQNNKGCTNTSKQWITLNSVTISPPEYAISSLLCCSPLSLLAQNGKSWRKQN